MSTDTAENQSTHPKPTVIIKMTHAEKTAIRSAAGARDLSMADFIRQAVAHELERESA